MDKDKINEILHEERKLLKDNRVYLVLELNEEDPDTFSMFCLDTTPNAPDKNPNVCQIIGRGLTDILSNDVEGLLDLGAQAIEKDNRNVGGNVISLDSYRKKKPTPSLLSDQPLTFDFSDEDEEDE